jgi:hypothetical protein
MKKPFVRVALALISTSIVAVAIFTGVYYLLTMGKELNNTNINDTIDYTTVVTSSVQSPSKQGEMALVLPEEVEFTIYKDYNLIKTASINDIFTYDGRYYLSLELLNEVLGYSFNLDVEENIYVIHNEEYELVFRENSDEVIRSSIYGGSPFYFNLMNYTYGVGDKLYIPLSSISTCFGVSIEIDDLYRVYFETIDYLYAESAEKLNKLGINLIEPSHLLVYARTVFVQNNKKGIISVDGDVIVPANFDEITELFQDIYLVKNGNDYGLYSYKGDIILECMYDNISLLDPYNKLVLVKEETKVGLANQNGKFVLPIIYTEIGTTSLTGLDTGMEESIFILGDCISVKFYGKYGIMSITGEEIIPPEFDSIGYIKRTKNEEGEYLETFLELYELDAVVVGRNGLYGAVNRQGEFVYPCEYKDIYFDENGWKFE